MNLNINPTTVLKRLSIFVAVLLIANILSILARYPYGHNQVFGLVHLFDFNGERNVPALYSSLALFFSSFFLLIIGLVHKTKKEPHLAWFGLAVIFLFLSMDEWMEIHERLLIPVQEYFNTSGYFSFAWIIPYGIAVLVFAISYIKFLQVLHKKIRNLFIISGAIYVFGAVGMEAVGGEYFSLYGWDNYMFFVICTIEELLEMVGIIAFIYTLLFYINTQFKTLTLTVNHKQ